MISHRQFEFLGAGLVEFQVGGSARVGEKVRNLGGKKVLISTDPGIVKANLLDEIIGSLEKAGIPCVVYDEVEPNPSVEVVEKGHDVLKGNGCDFLVGVGGGSAIDTAKAIGILATNPAPIKQYEGPNKVPNPIPPLIAIPTTAGTGSEVTVVTVITDRSRKYKMSIRSPYVMPKVALLDPLLLRSLPQRVIAETGMDALVHCVESFISINASPITEALALEAMRMIGGNFRAFYANPDNVEAASQMLIASAMAGISFANARLGCVHAMAHAMGGHYNITHGVACAVLLPHAMEYSLIAAPEKFVRIASTMGERTEGLSLWEAARKAVDAIRSLLRDVNIPQTLRELGVEENGIPRMAVDAVGSGIHGTTPRRIDLNGIEALFGAAF